MGKVSGTLAVSHVDDKLKCIGHALRQLARFVAD
jgi:hypothetical protein